MATSVKDLVTNAQVKPIEILVGMVTEIGTVTNIPGYNYQLKVLVLTQEEQLVTSHLVYIPALGRTKSDLSQELKNRRVMTVKDEIGRALSPIRGRVEWEERRNVFINHCSSFELYCKGRHDSTAECIAVFNERDKKRFLLPMPHLGWRLAILKFYSKSGHCFKFIFDGKPEQPLVRPKTAPASLRHSSISRQSRPSTSFPASKHSTTPSYMRVKPKPIDYKLLASMYSTPVIKHRWQ